MSFLGQLSQSPLLQPQSANSLLPHSQQQSTPSQLPSKILNLAANSNMFSMGGGPSTVSLTAQQQQQQLNHQGSAGAAQALGPPLPFRSASNRLSSFLQMHDGTPTPNDSHRPGGGCPPQPRFSFNEMPYNNAGEALLNSAMPRPPGGIAGLGPGISELLQNQMPSHKMSIDFTSQRQDGNENN